MTKNEYMKACLFEDALGKIMRGEVRQTKKLEKCSHGKYGYEDCENCISEYIQEVLLTSDCTRPTPVTPADGDAERALREYDIVLAKDALENDEAVVSINRFVLERILQAALQSTRTPSADTITVPREVLQGVREAIDRIKPDIEMVLEYKELHNGRIPSVNGLYVHDVIKVIQAAELALATLDAVLSEGE